MTSNTNETFPTLVSKTAQMPSLDQIDTIINNEVAQLPTIVPVVKPTTSNGPSMYAKFKAVVRANNIIALTISIIVASYLSEIIYYIINKVIMKKLQPLFKSFDKDEYDFSVLGYNLNGISLIECSIKVIIVCILLLAIIGISKYMELMGPV